MSDDDRAAVLDAVRLYVRAGFYNADEIAEIVEETVLEPSKADQDWLRGVIADAFGKKRQEEKSWPQETDCDRLDQLFEALTTTESSPFKTPATRNRMASLTLRKPITMPAENTQS